MLNNDKMKVSSNEGYEIIFLEKWPYVVKKDKKSTRDLFPFKDFILSIHGCIQQDKVIFPSNPSCNIFTSMLNWLKYCKYLKRMFNFLKFEDFLA